MSSPRAEELVKYLVTSLVEKPESVAITTSEREGEIVFEVSVDADDTGKIIGRQGRIIRAVRTLARAAGTLDGTEVHVEVIG